MSDDYLWDRSGPPDPDVAALEALFAPLRHDEPLDEVRMRRRRPRRGRWIALGVVTTAAAVIAIVVTRSGPVAPGCSGSAGFTFHGRGGPVSCGGASIAAGVLPVGGSLDTGVNEADLAIANIGAAELGPYTRVHLAHTGATQHQLVLDRGHLHARVNAPPRLFVVDTATTRVTDLGCEYTIDVDATGAGTIVVQSGQVELAARSGGILVAPARTRTAILAGGDPGLPLGSTARPALIDAVHAYEHRDPRSVAALLAAATPNDAITVVGLAIVDVPHRGETLARLAALSPPPGSVTVESAVRSAADLAAWRDDIIATYRRGGPSPAKMRR